MARYFDREGQPISMGAYLVRTTQNRYRRVADDRHGKTWVSTVWLGLDHSMMIAGGRPLIFETMVFGGPLHMSQRRYSSEAEARAGHAELVAEVRALPLVTAKPRTQRATVRWRKRVNRAAQNSYLFARTGLAGDGLGMSVLGYRQFLGEAIRAGDPETIAFVGTWSRREAVRGAIAQARERPPVQLCAEHAELCSSIEGLLDGLLAIARPDVTRPGSELN